MVLCQWYNKICLLGNVAKKEEELVTSGVAEIYKTYVGKFAEKPTINRIDKKIINGNVEQKRKVKKMHQAEEAWQGKFGITEAVEGFIDGWVR